MAAQTETGTHMLCTAIPELHITGVILAVIQGESLPGVLQLRLQHQIVSDTEGQTGFQRTQPAPPPGAEVVIVR
ncbi:hypothetical protein BvCmsKSP015_05093 [Escherichia coli]|nr:hypothetical protein BvCmsKSP015_05093 [Escherichia coli]